MHLILALIPILAFACLLFSLKQLHPSDLNRSIVIKAAIISGCYLVLSMEALSLVHGVSQAGLIVIWLLPLLACGARWGYKNRLGYKIIWPAFQLPGSLWDRLLFALLCMVIIVTGLVAWMAPPQTWDSLTYHLSRVAHWAQNQSVWHYVTGIDRQTSMPPGAELFILNLYVLTQSDKLANFPQWMAMLGSVVGMSLIAFHLGARSTGQWLAALFTATIPMGIVQASSSINDYMATFWVACVASETMDYYRTNENRSLVYLSLAAGLAILTKPTVIPYLLPFAISIACLLMKRRGVLVSLQWGAIALLAVGMLNGGYLARNYLTYGALSNPVDFSTHYNQLHSVQGWAVTALKNAGMNMGLPGVPGYNHEIYRLIVKVAVKLGLDINDPRMTTSGYFRVSPPSTAEDLVSNPYHAYIYVGSFLLLLCTYKKHARIVSFYAFSVVAAFLVFSFIYKWNGFGTRYQLPFFVLFTATASLVLARFEKLKLGQIVAILLVVSCYPWLFQIESRPLIPAPGSTLVQKSILAASPRDLYFANAPGERHDYELFTDQITDAGCSSVGLMLKGEDPEYLLWVLFDNPRAAVRIEWMVASQTSRYARADFEPCALICHGCVDGQVNIPGLSLAIYTHDMWLYLSDR